MTRCPNCSADLTHEYCAQCGQRRIDPADLSAKHVARELANEIASVRSKFKVVRSLNGLLIPGFLTAEYLAGRRQRHLAPIKVYLLCAALFFLAAPVAGFTLASMIADDPSGDLGQQVAARAAERGIDRSLFEARFDVRIQSIYTIAVGAGAIVIALMLQALFRGKRQPYGVHLVFALHYVSFMYLVTIVAGTGHAMGLSTNAVVLSAYLVIATYIILALPRVYADGRWAILWRAGVLLVLTLAVNAFASLAAIRLTLALA
jgi:hypothetical protein